MKHELDHFDDFHLHGASAPEWKQRYLQISGGEMRSKLAEANSGDLHVFRKWMSERVVQHGCVPAGTVCFGMLGGPVIGSPRIQGKELRTDSLFVLRSEEFSLQRPKNMEMLAVTFDAEDFMRMADRMQPRAAVRLAMNSAVLRAPAAPLERLRQALADVLRRAASRYDYSPSLATFEQRRSDFIAGLIFDTLGAAKTTSEKARAQSASALVNQCHAIVASSADFPPSVEELCARLRTSRRTLQNSFKQIADSTPLHYLRSVRLNAVRAQLLTTRAEDINVAHVAMNNGFTHLSHFAGEYKALFGELPSRTQRSQKQRRQPVRAIERQDWTV